MGGSGTVRTIVGPTILLYSGNYFDFLDPDNSLFTIEDVAHGLSNICRFGGQCDRFYSVAQHSVHVSEIVDPRHAYAGLMHDAAEAFIGDVTRPLKDLLPEYRIIERRIERAVFDRFGVLTISPEVKEADVVMLATEQEKIMRKKDDWDYTRGRKAAPIDLPMWGPEQSRINFLARFHAVKATASAPYCRLPREEKRR